MLADRGYQSVFRSALAAYHPPFAVFNNSALVRIREHSATILPQGGRGELLVPVPAAGDYPDNNRAHVDRWLTCAKRTKAMTWICGMPECRAVRPGLSEVIVNGTEWVTMKARIAQLEADLAHKDAYYAQFTLVPKPSTLETKDE